MNKSVREAKQIIHSLINLQSSRTVCNKLVRISLYLEDQVWQ